MGMIPMQFERSAPEAQGIDSAWLVRALEAAQTGARRGVEIHDFLLLRHGKLVCEAYFAPYGPEVKHAIYSQTKSFMATALGLAVGEGRLTLEDRVLPYFPEVNPDGVCENGRKMRVRDLLAMASGHDQDTMDAFRQGGPEAYFALPVPYEPGTHFLYNTGNSNMLGLLVERVTGQSLYAYLKARVFDKIGITIEDGDWDRVRGACSGGFGLPVRAFGSTDLGLSYLVEVDGRRVFHAGDFNLWHWEDESTPQEIAEATEGFERILADLADCAAGTIDLAFFPLDPRMGKHTDRGAVRFLKALRPKVLVPMHLQGDAALAERFAAQHPQVRTLTQRGQTLEID